MIDSALHHFDFTTAIGAILMLIVFAVVLFIWAVNHGKGLSADDFERGREYARQRFVDGFTDSQIRRESDDTFDFNDFNRGVLAELYDAKVRAIATSVDGMRSPVL